MEDRLWELLYQLVTRRVGPGRRKRRQFSDKTIVLLYLWAVAQERPMSWACRVEHLPRKWAGPMPSQATVSRRLREASLRRLCRDLERDLLGLLDAATVMLAWFILDAKPLVVGSYSKDRHARRGQAGREKARGYKLHARADMSGRVVRWAVLPMNRPESVVARGLVGSAHGPGYVLMDSGGDSVELYGRCASRGLRLIAPRKKPGTGLGNHRQHEDRLRAIAELEAPPGLETFGRGVYKKRADIERLFGRWTNTAGGLTALPNWVRTPRRVRRWVQAKIILYHARLLLDKELQR